MVTMSSNGITTPTRRSSRRAAVQASDKISKMLSPGASRARTPRKESDVAPNSASKRRVNGHVSTKKARGPVEEEEEDPHKEYEFGGPWGSLFIMVVSHILVLYMWACNAHNGGAALLPSSFTLPALQSFVANLYNLVITYASPTVEATCVYCAIIFGQALLMVIMPGVNIKGLPFRENGVKVQLDYNCNGVAAWYVTLILGAVCHFGGYYNFDRAFHILGPLTSVSMIAGDVVSLLTYVGAYFFGKTRRMSGNIIYDFFMGAWLNPRIGSLDLKMYAEVRVAWVLLFFVTCCAAAHQYETYGSLSYSMYFFLLANFLYTNACMKGEECIPTTWDIFYEKWGWMLIFWNFSGVPLVYTYQSVYVANHDPSHTTFSTAYTVGVYVLLFVSYYVWDTANSQKNHFRMQLRGTYVKRWAWPQLPWRTLANPRHIKTKSGSCLLTDGWYRYARKIHYTADIGMALSWGLMCGQYNFLPYFYCFFFSTMITHRYLRDVHKCSQKYGADWDEYCETVKYVFIPGVV